MTREEIVKALAAMEPTAPSETDGTLYCFFCNAFEPNSKYGEKHADDCIWSAAVRCAKS